MSPANQPEKILVIRNDKIGDFMLAWPSFSLLKSQYPRAEITALVPEYTAPLAEQCEWIDKVLIDRKKSLFFSDIYHLSKNIRKGGFAQSISLFSETRTSLALWLAGVKSRIGPATKIAQIFLNRRLRQKRSQSAKPEYEYNLDLIKYCIHLNHEKPVQIQSAPYLRFDQNEIQSLRHRIISRYDLTAENRLIIIHPGTGGSAINLSITQYADLAAKLADEENIFFIITAGPGELSHAIALSEKLPNVPHAVHESESGIIEFCKFINTADIFISGSTGPLHIAGALNIPTVAFYPAKRSASPLRWQTLNDKDKRLFFSPGAVTEEQSMNTIDTGDCASIIAGRFLK